MADESKRKRKVEFARKQLEKHGWCEGKGLGKEESGISKAIKVNIKTDTAGVGYDAGDQFSFHWWDHIFNKTAKSIVVQESDEGVEVVKSSKESCVVSSKRPSKNANKPLLYGRFVKASSQTQESVTPDSDGDSDAEKDFSNLCTEDKVFQACGGRTAHKAARHGFRLNGKLRRVQEQDKIAMAVESTTEAGCDSDNKIYENGEEQQTREKENKKKVKSKKKDKDRKNRKRKHKDTQKNNGHNVTDECDSCEGDTEQKQTKKKKRKRNK